MEVQDSGRDLVAESANIAFNTLDFVEEQKAVAEVNGYSKLSATEFIARGWWRVGIVRYPESIFRRVLHP
jgi:hypothetical protein